MRVVLYVNLGYAGDDAGNAGMWRGGSQDKVVVANDDEARALVGTRDSKGQLVVGVVEPHADADADLGYFGRGRWIAKPPR